MAKKKPDPADYQSWEDWQEARQKAGMMPEIAKPVPVALVFVVVVGIVAWIAAGRLGGTLDEEVLRNGTAEITGECHHQIDHRVCPADVTWDDGEVETDSRVFTTQDLQGSVEVEEHKTFVRREESNTARRSMTSRPVAWAADHRPDGRPWMFPLVFGGSFLGALIIAGFIIGLGSKWVMARSRRRWAFARGVPDPGPPPGGTHP